MLAQPDAHDYSEARKTRDHFIDLLLREAGWTLASPQDREYEVSGMPNAEGKGFRRLRPLGRRWQAACLGGSQAHQAGPAGRTAAGEALRRLSGVADSGRRPVIFYTNGYDHWLWDDANYPPRQVQGFYKKEELELLIQRRSGRKPLAKTAINEAIVERYYQTRCIRRVGEAFESDNDRKALVVMATGAGKTRTVIALCDLLMRCHWVKRVLFLTDRVALVRQAVNAFDTCPMRRR